MSPNKRKNKAVTELLILGPALGPALGQIALIVVISVAALHFLGGPSTVGDVQTPPAISSPAYMESDAELQKRIFTGDYIDSINNHHQTTVQK